MPNTKSKKQTGKQSNKQSKKQSGKLNYKLYLGCHISIRPSIQSGLEYLTHIKGNAAQIFIGSARSASLNAKHKFNDIEINDINKYIKQHNIYLCIHSIYLLNFCKAQPHSGIVKYMHDNIQYDLKHAVLLGAQCVIIHMGFILLLEPKIAFNNFINNINKIIKKMPDNISLALETSAGQGTQIGHTLNELAHIWSGVKHNNTKQIKYLKVGICIDTAHIFSSGYDISTLIGIKNYLNMFNKLIGWENIILFHINDSKYQCNSKKDVHQGIGLGNIFNTQHDNNSDSDRYNNIPQSSLKYIKTFCMKHNIPMILETHKTQPNTITYTKEIDNNINNTYDNKLNTGYEWEINYIKNI